MIKNFCTFMEEHRYFCGIYASIPHFNFYFNKEVKNRFSKWVAEYSDKCTYSEKYHMWQNSSSGLIPGINGYVDLDISYYDFTKIIMENNMNGF